MYTRLAPREHELRDLLLSELSLKEIAAEMKLTDNTTKTLAARLYKKCGVRDRIGLLSRTLHAAIKDPTLDLIGLS